MFCHNTVSIPICQILHLDYSKVIYLKNQKDMYLTDSALKHFY